MKIDLCKSKLLLVLCLIAIQPVLFAHAESPSSPKGNMDLPNGITTEKVNEFLATLRPPITFQSLERGNNLKLLAPDIAQNGLIKIGIFSALPKTDSIWLLTLDAQLDSGSAMLASFSLGTTVQPQLNIFLNLYKTQSLLLVARSGGKYYGVVREIKIGTPSNLATGK
ncbi:MAG: hypothetical protein RIT15_1442 [Pseudomonadota bacterium]|jgi:hypothetical protein